jgi:hypothetical protein
VVVIFFHMLARMWGDPGPSEVKSDNAMDMSV